MIVASRTPEGSPNHCPVCGAEVVLEPSRPPGDAPCPNCGSLLWFSECGLVEETLHRFGEGPSLHNLLLSLGLQHVLALRDFTGDFRLENAFAQLMLAGLAESESVDSLTHVLKSNDPAFRQQAARFLGSLGSTAQHALPALEMALLDEAPNVRLAAFEAITRIRT